MCLCSSFVLFRHQRDQHVPNPSGVAFAMAAVVGSFGAKRRREGGLRAVLPGGIGSSQSP